MTHSSRTLPRDDMRISEIMDPALTLHAKTSVREAVEMLARAESDLALVVDESRQPIGYVTLEALGIDAMRRRLKRPRVTADQATIASAMIATLPLPGDTSVRRASELMRWESMPCLAVTDAGGVAIGVVSADSVAFRDRFLFMPRQKRVMVVDDDVDICEALVDLLETEGFIAVAAFDGQHALDILKVMEHSPGLILLDLMMPHMNGWDFRRAQLLDERARRIPVVVLTAHGKLLQYTDLELRHPAAVLSKPFDIDELLETVERYFIH